MVLSHKGLSQPDMEGEQGRGRSGAGLAFQSRPKLRLGLGLDIPMSRLSSDSGFPGGGYDLGQGVSAEGSSRRGT